jgi:AcrR family transcriptional regulator
MTVPGPEASGRFRQKSRTRREITAAAIRLRDKGLPYTLDQVAEEAMVSRATVYRYFSSLSALNAELALAVRIQTAGELLAGAEPDPLSRVLKVHRHLFELVRTHEAEFRAYLKGSMDHWERTRGAPAGPLREGRRAQLLEGALAGLKGRLPAGDQEKLVQSLCLLTFIEPYIVLKDIFALSDSEADDVMTWAIEHLLAGALGPMSSRPVSGYPPR